MSSAVQPSFRPEIALPCVRPPAPALPGAASVKSGPPRSCAPPARRDLPFMAPRSPPSAAIRTRARDPSSRCPTSDAPPPQSDDAHTAIARRPRPPPTARRLSRPPAHARTFTVPVRDGCRASSRRRPATPPDSHSTRDPLPLPYGTVPSGAVGCYSYSTGACGAPRPSNTYTPTITVTAAAHARTCTPRAAPAAATAAP